MAADHSRRLPPRWAVRPVSVPTPHASDTRDWADDLAAIAHGRDRASFLRIYDHFMPRVCLYLRGLGSPEAIAEELAQEALLRLWQNADRYDPRQAAVSTWLMRIARNLHIDRVRREPNWVQVLEDALPGTEDELARPFSSAEENADHVQLARRIDELSAVQARLVRMSYLEAKSHHEIAQELDMPLGTVKSHLRRAFLRLQDRLRGTP